MKVGPVLTEDLAMLSKAARPPSCRLLSRFWRAATSRSSSSIFRPPQGLNHLDMEPSIRTRHGLLCIFFSMTSKGRSRADVIQA